MSYDTNVVVLTGRLTRDVEFSYTQQSNVALCKFSIANNPPAKTEKDVASFFNVIVWDKLAERCKQYLVKGSQILVVGRLIQRRYDDKEGQARSVIEIIGNSVQFLGPKAASENNENQQSSSTDVNKKESSEYQNFSSNQNASEFDDDEDEIPF